MTESKLINLDHLKRISGDNKNFVKDILRVFLANTPNDLEEMRQSFAGNNLEKTQYFAHKLKSSTDAIGFKKGRLIFQQIEDVLRDRREMERIPQLIAQAFATCAAAQQAVQKELEEGL